MAAATTLTEADIWERIIHPGQPMSKLAARRIQKLEFTDTERERMRELAERNRRGELSDDEDAEFDHLCRVGSLLTAMKLRARRILQTRGHDS